MDTAKKERLQRIVTENAYMQHLGIELLAVEQGYVKARMPYSLKITNTYGSIHGGALYSFADTVAGIAACTYGTCSSTIDGSMNYIRPAMNTRYVICEATEVRQGRQVSVYRTEIFNDDGLLLDTGTFTLYMMDQKLW